MMVKEDKGLCAYTAYQKKGLYVYTHMRKDYMYYTHEEGLYVLHT